MKSSGLRFSGFIRASLFSVLVVPVLTACLSKDMEVKPEDDGTPSTTVMKLNRNVSGLRDLAIACMSADSIAVFSIEYNDDWSVLYWLSMKKGGDIELYSEIVSDEIRVPELSMKRNGNSFFWTVNGAFLKDQLGERICVTDSSAPISFVLRGDKIVCRIKTTIIGEYPTTKADYLAKDVAFDYLVDERAFKMRLSSGYSTSIPTISAFRPLKEDVPNRSFYKDVFLDAGAYLSSRKSLAAADYLGLSLEGISFPYATSDANDKAMQTSIISGEVTDLNGRLLYPDGQPRYKLLFVNGGTSTSHGQSLGEKGLENMRTFVEEGGSYVGTCAGAFLASNGFDGKADYEYYLSIWPGMIQHTGMSGSKYGMYIEEDSPLLRYFDFGGDFYVDSVRHNNGGYPIDYPVGTEVLARYEYPIKKSLHKQPSIWAYKSTPKSGRVILEGSHPEEVKYGERLDLTAAMMLYAIDGVGIASIKGFLKNGEERKMDKKTSDNNPDYTRIGDLQTHHFAAYIPSGARNIHVELSSPSNCDLALMMNQETYAFSDVAEYRSSVPGSSQTLSFPSIREGLWFIGVQCLTTVTVKETDYGQEYGGNLEVLNGIPYRISIDWE